LFVVIDFALTYQLLLVRSYYYYFFRMLYFPKCNNEIVLGDAIVCHSKSTDYDLDDFEVNININCLQVIYLFMIHHVFYCMLFAFEGSECECELWLV